MLGELIARPIGRPFTASWGEITTILATLVELPRPLLAFPLLGGVRTARQVPIRSRAHINIDWGTMKRLIGGLVAVVMSLGMVAVAPAAESQAATKPVPAKCPAMSGYKLWETSARKAISAKGTVYIRQRTCAWRKGSAAKGYTYKFRVYQREKKNQVFVEYHLGSGGLDGSQRWITIYPPKAFVYNFGPYSFKKAKSKKDETSVWVTRRTDDLSDPDSYLDFYQELPASGTHH
jgi:hypothetical protein